MPDTDNKAKKVKDKKKKKGVDGREPLEIGENEEQDDAKTKNKKIDGDEDETVKGRIDVHTLNYFKRVEKLLTDNAFEDEESQGLFLNNVLAQVGKGPKTCQLARHRLTSTILEILIEMSSPEQFADLLESLTEEILTISRDRFGSHVLQKAVGMIPKHLNHSSEDLQSKIELLLFQLISTIKENLPALIRDLYASHIISTLIQVLAGIRVSDNVTRSRSSRASRGKFFKGDSARRLGSTNFGSLIEKSGHPVSEKFKKKLHKVTKRITKDYNFGELLCHKNASAVIQILLLALKETEERSCERLCNLIVEKSRLLQQSDGLEVDDTQKRVPILFADEIGSHVMEKIFHVASGDLYEDLFKKCFEKHLLQFSLHPLANYIVQHMLSNIPTAKMASAALGELIPFTEDILASGNMGVVIRMAELAQRFECSQKELMKALIEAVHLPPGKKERKCVIKLLLALSTYDVMFEKESAEEKNEEERDESIENESTAGQLTKETMNYHGACLLKVLFRFKDPKILVKSLLSLKDELLFLMRHEYGSFVIEEFLVSNNVAKVHKTNLLLRIKDSIVMMAKDKFGSHVIDKLWSSGTEDEKTMIRDELYKSRGQLKGNMYGRIVLRNCGIDSFQIPNKTNGVESSREKQMTKVGDGESRVEKKKKKKRKMIEEPSNEVEDIIENKKLKASYDDELQKLGVGINDDEKNNDELKRTKTKSMGKVEMESSNEIEELFAKGRLKKKTKDKTRTL